MVFHMHTIVQVQFYWCKYWLFGQIHKYFLTQGWWVNLFCIHHFITNRVRSELTCQWVAVQTIREYSAQLSFKARRSRSDFKLLKVDKVVYAQWYNLNYTHWDISSSMNTFSVQLALYVLSFLEPRDLLRAAQTCRNWRFLSEDNLLWRVKCREASVEMDSQISKRLRHRPPTNSHPPSPWKVSSSVCTKCSKVNLFKISRWTIKIHRPHKNKPNKQV